MLVERDGHLRFEAEVSLQGTVATLATDGTTFALLDAQKNEFSRGPACPANVASLIRIPLAPADVAAVLLGDARAPARRHPAAATVGWDAAAAPTCWRCRCARAGRCSSCFAATARRGRWSPSIASARPASRCGGHPTRITRPPAARASPALIRFAEANSSFDDGVEIKFKDRTLNAPPARGRVHARAAGRRDRRRRRLRAGAEVAEAADTS